MRARSAAAEYANILYLVCKENDIVEEVMYDSKSLLKLSLELKRTFMIPTISKEIRKDIINELSEVDVQKEVINLFKLLIDANAIHLFPEILIEFETLYQSENDIIIVHATIASDLTSEQKDNVRSSLEKKLDKFVVVIYEINPAIIGGIKFEYNGKSINNTISKQLELIKNIY